MTLGEQVHEAAGEKNHLLVHYIIGNLLIGLKIYREVKLLSFHESRDQLKSIPRMGYAFHAYVRV